MADLHAVERLAVGGVGFAADMVADAGFGHQVAFIGRVDKHLTGKLASALHDDLHDARAVLDHALLEVETFAKDYRHLIAGGLEHPVVDGGGHVWLEGPHRTLVGDISVGALREVGFAGLVDPLLLVRVMRTDGRVEFAGDPADGLLVADVRGAEAAGGQATEELGRLDEYGCAAFAGRLDGRGDAAGGTAVDDDVLGGEGGGQAEEGQQQGAHGDALMSAGPVGPAIPFRGLAS